MEELLNPVQPFMTDEEAAFYHQKIDCMFPASGVLGKKGRLKKMRFKNKKRKSGSCPFKTSHGIDSSYNTKLESNPFIRRAASSQECLLEGVKGNTATKPQKVLENLEQKILKRRFNQSLITAEDQVLTVYGQKERQSTSKTIYLVIPEPEKPPAKKLRKENKATSGTNANREALKLEVDSSNSWDTLSVSSSAEERLQLFLFYFKIKAKSLFFQFKTYIVYFYHVTA